METISDKHFGPTKQVVVDGHRFVHCHFERCTLFYEGSGDCGFEQCRFESPAWMFGGGAMKTVGFLSALFEHSPEWRDRLFPLSRTVSGTQ